MPFKLINKQNSMNLTIMKNTALILTISISMLMPAQLMAQFKRVGIKAGVNLSQQRISNQDEFTRAMGLSTDYITAATAGFLF